MYKIAMLIIKADTKLLEVLNRIPGNGRSFIDCDFELSVIMMGESDHFIQIVDIKYIERRTTTKNMQAKNVLQIQ